jgi:hypothetical protein
MEGASHAGKQQRPITEAGGLAEAEGVHLLAQRIGGPAERLRLLQDLAQENIAAVTGPRGLSRTRPPART